MLTVTEDIKGKRYKQLINLLLKRSNRFAFVENRQMMENEEVRLAYIETLTNDIKESLIERKVQRKWETTKLSSSSAYVFYFNLNNATKLFLIEHSHSLFGWINPDLPEDLMFYYNDKCLLAACSHEGYFVVDESLWQSFIQ